MEINLESLLKLYGPLGLIVGVLLLFIWKGLLPKIEQQAKENREQSKEMRDQLAATLDDARKERDLMRSLREKEVDKFLESLKYRDDKFEAIAEAVLHVERKKTRQ